jgi:hypothetical protein
MRILAKFGCNNGGEKCGRWGGEKWWWEEQGMGVLYRTDISPPVRRPSLPVPTATPATNFGTGVDGVFGTP